MKRTRFLSLLLAAMMLYNLIRPLKMAHAKK